MVCRSVIFGRLLRLALVVGAVGCSRSGGDADSGAATSTDASSSRLGSCDRISAMSVCSEYSGVYLAQNEPVLRSSCSKLGGVYVAGECPNTSVLGSCILPTSEVRKFHSSGGASYDATRAEKECASAYKGKWTGAR